MPRVLLTRLSPPVFSSIMYTPDQAVGRNAPNDRTDVLLVQFMLRVATSGKINWSSYQIAPAANPSIGRLAAVAHPLSTNLPGTDFLGDPIVIDGICGPQTISFIESFQREMVQRGDMSSPVDGQVAPLGNDRQPTIRLLDTVLFQAAKQGLFPMDDLRRSPFFPRELSDYFYE